MSKLVVHYDDVAIVDEAATEQYGQWKREREFSIHGVGFKPSLQTRNETISIAPAVVAGDTVWVLWVEYSTGDSFGSDSGRGEVMWVFVDEDVANNAADQCRIAADSTSLTFQDEDGEVIHLSNPAHGYFERLTDVHVVECVVA